MGWWKSLSKNLTKSLKLFTVKWVISSHFLKLSAVKWYELFLYELKHLKEEAQVLLKTITFIDVLRLENVSLSCVTHYCLHCLYKFVKVATWNYVCSCFSTDFIFSSKIMVTLHFEWKELHKLSTGITSSCCFFYEFLIPCSSFVSLLDCMRIRTCEIEQK